MKKTLFFLAIFVLSVTHAEGFTFDLSALSSSNTRQLSVSAAHIHQNPKSLMEVSGKYTRTQDKEPLWDVGVGQEFYYPLNLRAETEYRYFQDRNTYAGGLGFGHRWVSITGGIRVESPNDGDRQTYSRVSAIWRGKKGNFGVSAKLEGLRASSTDKRWDYKVEAKHQLKRFYVAFRFEDVRQIELQAISVGVKF